MTHEDIEKLNLLAKKSKAEGLTSEEKQEQEKLRKQYLEEFRKNAQSILDRVEIKELDGSIHPLKKKEE